MSNLLNKFSLSAIKFNGTIAACIVVLWLVVVGTAISSIFSQPFSKKQRTFWILMVVFLPVLGLLLYLPFSVKHDEYPLLFNWKHKK
jgi:fatty acid desaturase